MAVLDRRPAASRTRGGAASKPGEAATTALLVVQLDEVVNQLARAQGLVDQLRTLDPARAAAYVESIQDALVDVLDI